MCKLLLKLIVACYLLTAMVPLVYGQNHTVTAVFHKKFKKYGTTTRYTFILKKDTLTIGEKAPNRVGLSLIANQQLDSMGVSEGKLYFKFYNKRMKALYEGTWLLEYFEGPYKSYYKNGNLKLAGVYDLGWKVGEWKRYNRKGELVETKKFFEKAEDYTNNVPSDYHKW